MGLGKSKRPVVLIVEDEFLLRLEAVDTIVAAGFDVVEAANADEAVEILVKAAPELKSNIETAKWQATIPATTSAATEKDGLGVLDRAKWEHLNDLLKTYSVIEAKVDLDVVLKNNFR